MNCTMKYGLLSMFLASTFSVQSWAQEPTVVPMITAAYHVSTFQNENMVLESVTLPPGASTGYHSHDQDLFFAITGGAKVRNQAFGKEPVATRIEARPDRIFSLHKDAGNAPHHQSRKRTCHAARWPSRSLVNRGNTRYRPDLRNMKSPWTMTAFAFGG